MNYTETFKRQTIIILGSILVVAIIIIGASFALFTTKHEGTQQTLSAGTLDATFTQGTVLTTNMVPLEDSEATSATDNLYTFNLTNSGTLPVNYQITIANNGTTNMLAHKYIKVSYDGGTGVYLNSLAKVDSSQTNENNIVYVLKSGVLANGVSNEKHTIRIWISDVDSTGAETDTDIIGKTIGLKVGLSGTVSE